MDLILQIKVIIKLVNKALQQEVEGSYEGAFALITAFDSFE